MTKISLHQDGRHMCVSACGHAAGSAAACAGVSAIFYALYGFLRDAQKRKTATIRICRLQSGDAMLDFYGDAAASAAFDMAQIGLRQIAEGYPASVCVEE